MLEAQKESVQMIIWSIILFQLEKNILELETLSARVSCVFALKKKSHLALPYSIHMECFLLKFLIIIP